MPVAARAMRRTGRPVGLLVWRGRHAWVMSGFEAIGDPMLAGSRVTAALIEDSLFPYGSSTWGPSPSPGEALSVKDVGRQFVRRRFGFSIWSTPDLAGKYVLVVPYELDFRTCVARRSDLVKARAVVTSAGLRWDDPAGLPTGPPAG